MFEFMKSSQDPKYTLQTIFSSAQSIWHDTLQIDILQPTIFFAPCRRSFWRHPADVFWKHPADNTPCRPFLIHPADNKCALCRRSWLWTSQTLCKRLHSLFSECLCTLTGQRPHTIFFIMCRDNVYYLCSLYVISISSVQMIQIVRAEYACMICKDLLEDCFHR